MQIAAKAVGAACACAAGVGIAMSTGLGAATAEPSHEFTVTNNTNIDVTLMEFVDASRPCPGSAYPDVGSLLRAGSTAVFKLSECSTTVKPKYQGTGPDHLKAVFKVQMKNGQNNYSAGCAYLYGGQYNAFYACGPVNAEGVDKVWMGGTGVPGVDGAARSDAPGVPAERPPRLAR